MSPSFRRRRDRRRRPLRTLFLAAAAAYLLVLVFPQVFFAHEISHERFFVHARAPLAPGIQSVLDSAQTKLSRSPLDDPALRPRVFLCDSHRTYSLLSAGIRAKSFGKGFGLIPAQNVFINRSDPARNLVFRDAPADNERELDDVIAHEATHLLLRKKLGYVGNLTAPEWKREGYCEYVAGGSTLSDEEGTRRWKANPSDDSRYRYFKYRQLVAHLLDTKKLSVEEMFSQKIDRAALEKEVLSTL